MILPSGYTQLEYIKSSGTQYIDTNFIPNQDTRVVCKCTCPSLSSSSNFVFGGRISSSSIKFSFGSTSTSYYVGYGIGSTIKCTKISVSNNILNIDANKSKWTITTDSTTELTSTTYSTFTSPVSLCLFACNTNGTINYGSVKIYSFQLYDNGVLIRNFIPCKNANNIIGMYDGVNNVFYSNSGTGSFVAGPVSIAAYEVVNATELNGALSLTADAIRSKGEHSNEIVWNPSIGFTSAINAISTGVKVATGSFTSNGEYITGYPKTITGLQFKPSRVIIQTDSSWANGIIVLDTGINRVMTYWENYEEYEDEETGETWEEWYDYTEGFELEDLGISVTFNTDGFTVSAHSYYDGAYWGYGTYHYIAIE